MAGAYDQADVDVLRRHVQEHQVDGSKDMGPADLANCRVLCAIAPDVVPVLQSMGDATWPSERRLERRPKGLLSTLTPEPTLAPPFKVLLRRHDVGTLRTDWRLEAAGPMGFFEWDDSGRITGNYGYRYPVYSVRPVFEQRQPSRSSAPAPGFALGDGRTLFHAGFAINCRPLLGSHSHVTPIDARIDAPVYVRSNAPTEVVHGLSEVTGKPRVEEGRPGISPTDAYFDLMEQVNRTRYFQTWGYNEYISPGWNSESLMNVFADPSVRAVWLPPAGERLPQ